MFKDLIQQLESQGKHESKHGAKKLKHCREAVVHILDLLWRDFGRSLWCPVGHIDRSIWHWREGANCVPVGPFLVYWPGRCWKIAALFGEPLWHDECPEAQLVVVHGGHLPTCFLYCLLRRLRDLADLDFYLLIEVSASLHWRCSICHDSQQCSHTAVSGGQRT